MATRTHRAHVGSSPSGYGPDQGCDAVIEVTDDGYEVRSELISLDGDTDAPLSELHAAAQAEAREIWRVGK